MSGQTFDRKQGLRRAVQAVAGMAWGLVPLAAQAQSPPQTNMVFMTAAASMDGCAPPVGAEPVTMAAEPRAEALKDAPFSGVGTTEVVTTLADGNRIVRTNTMKFYRDKSGRTRTEYSLNAIGPFTPDQMQSVVTINDPLEGKSYVLHSAMKRADVFKLGNFGIGKFGAAGGGMATGRVVSFGAAKSVGEGPATAGTPRGAPPRVATTMRSTVMAPTMMPRGAGVAVAPPVVVMSTTTTLPPPPNGGVIMQYAAPPAGIAAAGCKPNTKALPAPTSLGERIIEGLKVTGTRMEFTIPQGAVGNEQPILVSSEQWFSPELGVVVASTHRDPMMGDTNYKLDQINRIEPDASLFTVPSDYTQTDVGANGMFFEKQIGPGGEAGVSIREESKDK
jgi:hypothetical protein